MNDYTLIDNFHFTPLASSFLLPMFGKSCDLLNPSHGVESHPQQLEKKQIKSATPVKIQKFVNRKSYCIRLSGYQGSFEDCEVKLRNVGHRPYLTINSKIPKFRRFYKLDPGKMDTRGITYAHEPGCLLISIPKRHAVSNRLRKHRRETAGHRKHPLRERNSSFYGLEQKQSFGASPLKDSYTATQSPIESNAHADNLYTKSDHNFTSSRETQDLASSPYHYVPTLEEVEDEETLLFKKNLKSYATA